ncbi:hypothetical protein ZWY2020_017647 [Hordeum vulgare]|nr:hypothetical protein ZWY2020_017647 [Hordeum vulgare]
MLAATADGNSKFTCTDTEKKRLVHGHLPRQVHLVNAADQVQPVRPSLFVFGDGLTDVGNNNYLENNEVGNPLRANHSYYGIDFPNSVATGRFSNGFNMADFIDSKTDVPHLISSYGDSLTALYNLGARKFGIINVLTLCELMVRHGCEGLITSLREEFNDGIRPPWPASPPTSVASATHRRLRRLLGCSQHGSVGLWVCEHRGACCQGSCAPSSGPCANRSQYWYWDEENPTEQAAKLVASAFFDGTTQFTTPVNFKTLIS